MKVRFMAGGVDPIAMTVRESYRLSRGKMANSYSPASKKRQPC